MAALLRLGAMAHYGDPKVREAEVHALRHQRDAGREGGGCIMQFETADRERGICIYICIYVYHTLYIYICLYACACVCVCLYVYRYEESFSSQVLLRMRNKHACVYVSFMCIDTLICIETSTTAWVCNLIRMQIRGTCRGT